MADLTPSKVRRDESDATSAVTLQKWGGIAAFLLAVTFIVPLWLYLTGRLGVLSGPLAYDLADFLYGPVWGASLVITVLALRERIGELAPRQGAPLAGDIEAWSDVDTTQENTRRLYPRLSKLFLNE